MNYQVTIPPTTSVVTVADLKTHLLLFGDNSYDAELQDLLLTAESFVSDFLGEFLSETAVQINLPTLSDIFLPHRFPSEVHVSFWDDTNMQAPVPPSLWLLDTSYALPKLHFKGKPSNISTDFDNQGFVTYKTSLPYAPPKIRHAVLLIAAELFENRNNSSDKKMEKVQLTAMRLIQSARGW